jgi:hypothetical protein
MAFLKRAKKFLPEILLYHTMCRLDNFINADENSIEASLLLTFWFADRDRPHYDRSRRLEPAICPGRRVSFSPTLLARASFLAAPAGP